MRVLDRGRLQTLTAALTSEQGVLGLLTANDLFWRTLADLPAATIQRYAQTLTSSHP